VLALAALGEGIDRFVHVSSTSAYGHPAEGKAPIDESAPLGQNIWMLDYYTRSKVECERMLWQMAGTGLPLTVIRPSWLFGERDRTTAPRLVREFRGGRMMLVGKGDNPLSAVYAGVVADAALAAARDPGSRGEAYNITSHCPISQREFLDLFADALAVPRVTRQLAARAARPRLEESSAPARDTVRSLAAGPQSGIQHRKGPYPIGLAAGARLPREPRQDNPLGARARGTEPQRNRVCLIGPISEITVRFQFYCD
jgi:nucleoside-diphosphate-sugar epimerase